VEVTGNQKTAEFPWVRTVKGVWVVDFDFFGSWGRRWLLVGCDTVCQLSESSELIQHVRGTRWGAWVWVVWFWIGVWVWFVTIPITASWRVQRSVGRCVVKGWHRGFWFFWASVSVIDWIVEGGDVSADRR
jgi:hypothetical protein